MVLATVEAVPAGSKPPAAVSVRISTSERHGFGAAAPFCRSWRHPCNKGEPEVLWSHRQSWSDTSGRDRPGQKSCPHSSLDLLQRSPYACESWCQLVHLPP